MTTGPAIRAPQRTSAAASGKDVLDSRSRQNASRPSSQARRTTPRERTSDGFGWLSPHAIAGLVSLGLIVVGAWTADDLDLSPASSFGYGLGILGLAMMGVLLAYSVRKRARALRHVGSLRNWFELHLVLGMLAPAVILYHANFRVESANAAVSLACLLIVAGSGVGGRYLYGRLYRSLAGERRSVEGMQRQARRALEPIGALLDRAAGVEAMIAGFEARSVGLTSGLLRALPALALRPRARLLRRPIQRALRAAGATPREVRSADTAVAECLGELCRAGELRLFSQLFALWHAVHIPLTVILFLSAFIHVLAVHLY